MPKILAIDCSGAKTRVALCLHDHIHEFVNEEPRQAAQTLLPLIQSALQNGSIEIAELDAIAVTTGPGSFTGLRIGIGVAQGLSAANATPLIGVSSLALFAKAAAAQSKQHAFLVCLPAREHEVYFAGFRLDQTDKSKLHQVIPEQVIALNNSDLPRNKPEEQAWMGVGDGWAEQDYRKQLETRFGVKLIACIPNIEPEMKNLWEIAVGKLSRMEVLEAEQLLPNYVKEQLDYLS